MTIKPIHGHVRQLFTYTEISIEEEKNNVLIDYIYNFLGLNLETRNY
jgi:hypothetical protein